jgi:orotidine-5'-phosphate decarboxylase
MSSRDHLAIALDVDDLVVARRLAGRLAPWFGVAKVGLELFSAAGPEAVGALRALGYRVFVDLKLHDIPNTVGRAARVLGSLGADLATMHAAGGEEMLRAGVESLLAGAEAAELPRPVALGVTVLTSETSATDDVIEARVRTALAAGCGGLVCSPREAAFVRRLAPGALIVTPGVRPKGSGADDQARVATPAAAIAAGADLLVIGRPVTAAGDPEGAAAAIAHELDAA